jgi:hypothetical protein
MLNTGDSLPSIPSTSKPSIVRIWAISLAGNSIFNISLSQSNGTSISIILEMLVNYSKNLRDESAGVLSH